MQSEQEKKRESIIYKYAQNNHCSFSTIAREVGVSLSTVTRVIKHYITIGDVKRKPGSGFFKKPVNKDWAGKVVGAFKANPGLSIRDVAKRYGMSKSEVCRLKKKCGLTTYKKFKAPNRTQVTNTKARSRARKLYDFFLNNNPCIIMDDETYVKGDFKQLPGSQFYVQKIGTSISMNYKIIRMDKFAKEYMVWQAICSCGIRTTPFVTNQTMGQDLYVKECLQKRLLTLVRKHRDPVIFWPEIASCHYAKRTMVWYEAKCVTVVPKVLNPPNYPELRPIENFWALRKRNLKKIRKTARDIESFKKKWNIASRKVPNDLVKLMMSRVKGKVIKFAFTVEK